MFSRYKIDGIAVFLIFLVLLTAVIRAESGKIDKEVYSALDKEKEISVVIDIKDSLGMVVKKENLEKIKKEVDETSVSGDLIAATISRDELEKLEDNSVVEKVEYSPEFKIALQDSAGIVNASRLWNLQIGGINLTGIDETVCVLDTGINFSHPALLGKNKTCIIDCLSKACIENCSVSDDNGHGTHVAGIIAASSGINGISPGAGLIGLKVLDSAGDSSAQGTTDIKNAIDWCVANRNLYNISVISMSLGTKIVYLSYCDSSFSSTITKAINNATLYNISVIAASGNSGNGVARSTTSIVSPACIQNATAVSATNKDDSIASYAHYSSLVDLVAPGTSINSTWLSGYALESGTSMATPHVAAAFSIIHEFYKLSTGGIYTPAQIKSLLKNNGKNISGEGVTMTRIDVYNALESISFNYANIVSPANNLSTRINQTFSCNVSSNVNLSNVTFSIWNSSSLVYNETKNISGLINSSNFSYNFTLEGGYLWACNFVNALNFAKLAGNYSVTYDLTSPSITVVSPANNSWQNAGRFNVSLNENGGCIYSMNNLGNASMNSTDSRNFWAVNFSLIQDSVNNVTYYCNDSAGNTNSSSLMLFRVDLISPNVVIILPENGYSATGTTTVSFQYNASDNLNVSRCDLILNGASVAGNSSSINNTNTVSYSVAPDSYTWQINCTDEAGNTGNSSSRTITINPPPVQISSSGGGGGGAADSAKTYSISTSQISAGYSQELKKDDVVKFTLSFDGKSETHSVVTKKINAESIDIEINSERITATLRINEEKKFNLNSDNWDDLKIRLNSISNGKANLTIAEIHESISFSPPEENDGVITETEEKKLDIEKINKTGWIYIGLYISSALGLLALGYIAFRKFHHHLRVKLEVKWDKRKK